MSTPATASPLRRRLGRSRTWPMLASTLKPGPRYLVIVLALVGDSTTTRACFLLPLAGLRPPLAASPLPRATARFVAAGFLRPDAGGAAAASGCFLRAGTGCSPGLLLCCGVDSLQSPFWLKSAIHPYYSPLSSVKAGSPTTPGPLA